MLTHSHSVAQLYVSLFDRAPDSAGLRFWRDALDAGASWQTVIEGFLNAPEGQRIYSPTASADGFIQAFYQAVLGRPVDAGGLVYWRNVLDAAGGTTSVAARAQVVDGIVKTVSGTLDARGALTNAEYHLTLNDRATFNNKVSYALARASTAEIGITDDLSLDGIDASTSSLKAALANLLTVHTNAALSSNATLLGSTADDVFRLSPDAYLAAGDRFAIDGQGGNDTLWLTPAQSALTIAGTNRLTQVDTVTVTASAGAPVRVDAAAFATAQRLGVQDTLGAVTIFGITGQQAHVTGNLGAAVNVDHAAGVQTAVLRLDGVQNRSSDIVVSGNDLTRVDIHADHVTSHAGRISLSSSVQTINVDAYASLWLALQGVSQAALTVSGGGTVDFGTSITQGIHSFDAAQNEGGVRITLVDARSVRGGEGRDIVTLAGSLAADSRIDLGAGNDSLRGSVTSASGAVIDGGEGVDTVSGTLLTSTNLAQFLNFEVLELAGPARSFDVRGLTGSDITGVWLSEGSEGGTVTGLDAGAYLTVRGPVAASAVTHLVVNGADTRTDDALAIDFTGASVAQPYAIAPPALSPIVLNAGTVSLPGIEHVTISSGASTLVASNAVVLDATSMQTLRIAGDNPLGVSFAATGAMGLIDASASTGGVTISLAQVTPASIGLSVLGGSGNDVFRLTSPVTLATGAGRDRIELDDALLAGATSPLARRVDITDYTAQDSIVWRGISVGPTSATPIFDANTSPDLAAAAQAAVRGNVEVSSNTFRFGSELYIAIDADGFGNFGAGDMLVKLVGVSAL